MNQSCQFILMYWKRLFIILKDRLLLFDYPIIKCIIHKLENIDCYYPTGISQKLYLNANEWLNSVSFLTCCTKNSPIINKVNTYKAYKISFSFLSFIWSLTFSGEPIINIMKTLNTNYSTTLQQIITDYYNEDSDLIQLQSQFEGKSNNKYLSNSLLNRNSIQSIIKSIQKSYIRDKWMKFKSIYHERPVLEACFDATFGLCSKLYAIKNGIWHLLKVSFGHIEDDIGLTIEGILLPNASESHERILSFIADFLVVNIQNCKWLPSDFTLKIGTDNSARDCNIGGKLIKLLKDKLNVTDEFPFYTNYNGITFNISKFKIIVKYIP